MKLKISSGRLNYEPKYDYRDGVLINTNWYEERMRYIKEKHLHDTTYSREFYEKGPSFVHPDIFWDHKIKAEGIGTRLMMDHEGEKYHENYSTTYDISYNIMPELLKNRKLRVFNPRRGHFLPQQDYALNFGNATNYGLRERKKRQWEYEMLTSTDSYTTDIRDNYVKPELSAYTLKRKAIPRERSSILFPPNLQMTDVTLRDSKISLVPDIPLDVLPRMYPHFYF